MLEKIVENIYKVVVPLPGNPLKELNAYIIKGERSLLIDTGFDKPECEKALRDAFEELGIEEVDVFLTHFHADHSGLVSKMLSENSILYMSEIDGELFKYGRTIDYWIEIDDLFAKYGMPRFDVERNSEKHPGFKHGEKKILDITYIQEGDVLEYGGYSLQAIITPGHTPGHCCLYDAKDKILFCGDHILFNITPNICIEINEENPLKDYFSSLDKVEELEVDVLLTAHRAPVNDMHGRIKELYLHHKERLEEVDRIITDQWQNAYEIAGQMHWSIRCNGWDDFPPQQKWFATGEAIAHLQYLYYTNRIVRQEVDGIYCYRKK